MENTDIAIPGRIKPERIARGLSVVKAPLIQRTAYAQAEQAVPIEKNALTPTTALPEPFFNRHAWLRRFAL
jgi:hypothetical protein